MNSDEVKAVSECGQYVDVNGLNMYYEDRGKGQALVLVHGGMQTALLGWMDLRMRFAEQCRVIAPDSRGCGRTDNPEERLDYRLMADDVVALGNALDLEQPIVCGWSDGGQIALEIGIRHPAFAKALVVGGAMHELAGQAKDALSAIPGVIQSDPKLVEMVQEVHGHVYGSKHWETLLDWHLQMWLNPTSYPLDTIKSIDIPSLLIIGDKDEYVSLESQFEMHNLIPNSELAIIPNMTHMGYRYERSEMFAFVILDFIKRIS